MAQKFWNFVSRHMNKACSKNENDFHINATRLPSPPPDICTSGKLFEHKETRDGFWHLQKEPCIILKEFWKQYVHFALILKRSVIAFLQGLPRQVVERH